MNTFLLSAPAEPLSAGQFVGCLIGAIVAMAAAVSLLHREAMSRMDRDKKEIKEDFDKHKTETKLTIEKLNNDLMASLKGEQDARLKAATYEIIAKTPCPLSECPRRSTSFSIGEAQEKVI